MSIPTWLTCPCVIPGGDLTFHDANGLQFCRCAQCGREHPIINGMPQVFLNEVDRTTQYEPETIGAQYDSRNTFIHYHACIQQALNLKPKRILEIGIGNKVVANYLNRVGVETSTMDIEPAFGPDVCASMTAMPVQAEYFDIIMFFQVLEHLPLESVPAILRDMARLTRRYVLFSVPDARFVLEGWLGLSIATRHLIDRYFMLPFPRLFKRGLPPLAGEHTHYWEISRSGFPMSHILQTFAQVPELQLIKTYRVAGCSSHRIFLMKRSDGGRK